MVNTEGFFLVFFVSFIDEVHSCLWQDCGFCSVELDGELLRHMFFHCYHAKLKQWGSAILKHHPDMGTCSVGLQNRNFVPEVQDSFLCLWEHCEVSEIEGRCCIFSNSTASLDIITRLEESAYCSDCWLAAMRGHF